MGASCLPLIADRCAVERMDVERRLGKVALHALPRLPAKPSLPSQGNDGSGQADCEHYLGTPYSNLGRAPESNAH